MILSSKVTYYYVKMAHYYYSEANLEFIVKTDSRDCLDRDLYSSNWQAKICIDKKMMIDSLLFTYWLEFFNLPLSIFLQYLHYDYFH